MNRSRCLLSGGNTALLVPALALLAIAGCIVVAATTAASTVARLEDQEAAAMAGRAIAAISDRSTRVAGLARVLSASDEMFDAVAQGDAPRVSARVAAWAPAAYGLDAVLVVATDGAVLASSGSPGRPSPSAQEAGPEIESAVRGSQVSGMRGYPSGIYLIGCTPVLRGDGSGPPAGCVLAATAIDDSSLADLEGITGASLAVSWRDVFIPSAAFSSWLEGRPTVPPAARTGPIRIGENLIVAAAQTMDAVGRDEITVHTAAPRPLHTAAVRNRNSLVGLAVIACLAGLACAVRALVSAHGSPGAGERRPAEQGSPDAETVVSPGGVSLARTDPVTGLDNYRSFHEHLAVQIEGAKRSLRPLALALLDINYFKFYNNSMGHARGDELLRSVGAIIAETAGGAFSARCTGDDFGLILPNTDSSSCRAIMHQIAEKVQRLPSPGRDLLPQGRVTVSYGVAVFPDDGTTKDALLRSAQMDLDLSRTSGMGKALRYFNAFTSVVRPGGDSADLLASAQVLLAIIDSVDRYTYWHTQRVVRYASWIASKMGLAASFLDNLRLASFLHDVGKIEIDREILAKPGPLNPKEWGLMKMHPAWGAGMVRPVEKLRLAAPLIESHHERYDGKGYPLGISRDDIPLGARIIAVADAFDAMTTHRPYRKASAPVEALAELQRCSGTQFDPDVVEAFVTSVKDPVVMRRLVDESERPRPPLHLR